MEYRFLDTTLDYTGKELRPHFIYTNFGILGDAVISFIGRADVRDAMVDLADIKNNEFIYSPLMLHFIIEHFGMGLREAVVRQRLFIAIIKDYLPRGVIREGDDLFFDDRKLSVSIATVSPVSALIHVGLNIKSDGVPVKASDLKELKVSPKNLALKVMAQYKKEVKGIELACCKVIPK